MAGSSPAITPALAMKSRSADASIHPHILEAPAVEDAVEHDRHAVDARVPAGGEVVAVDDRPGGVLGQLLVDFPDQLLALLLVRLHRLPVVQLLEFGVA